MGDRGGYARPGGQGYEGEVGGGQSVGEDTKLLSARYESALGTLTRDMDKAIDDLAQLAKDYAVP